MEYSRIFPNIPLYRAETASGGLLDLAEAETLPEKIQVEEAIERGMLSLLRPGPGYFRPIRRPNPAHMGQRAAEATGALQWGDFLERKRR